MRYTYARLVEALGASVQGDADGIVSALSACDAQVVFRHAARHKVADVLLAAFAQLRIHDQRLQPLRTLLQQYAGHAVASAGALHAQIDAVAQTLNAAAVPHAFLKTAGRVCGGDARARWTPVADIDVLVHEGDVERAARALLAGGYRCSTDDETATRYRANHHHLAPFSAPGNGKPLELHVALAPPRMFGIAWDFDALSPNLVQPDPARAFTYVLDPRGRALHAMIHGVGLYRVADAAIIATELRARPQLLRDLAALARSDAQQRTAMLAVLHLASVLAGQPTMLDRDAQRCAEWCVWREDLPERYRTRAQLVDAWFASGGRFHGPALANALPPERAYYGERMPLYVRARMLSGMLLACGVAAANYGVYEYAARR